MVAKLTKWPIVLLVASIFWGGLLFNSALSSVDYRSWWLVRLLAPVPYRDVIITQQYPVKGGVYVSATFYKNEACEKTAGEFFGRTIGPPVTLEWLDGDGRPDDESRIGGRTTLHGVIITKDREFNTLELRLRHYCYGRWIVDENGTARHTGRAVETTFFSLDPRALVTRDKPRSVNDHYIGPDGGY